MKTHWKRSEESVKIEFNKSMLNSYSTKIPSSVGRERFLLTDKGRNIMLKFNNRCMGHLVGKLAVLGINNNFTANSSSHPSLETIIILVNKTCSSNHFIMKLRLRANSKTFFLDKEVLTKTTI